MGRVIELLKHKILVCQEEIRGKIEWCCVYCLADEESLGSTLQNNTPLMMVNNRDAKSFTVRQIIMFVLLVQRCMYNRPNVTTANCNGVCGQNATDLNLSTRRGQCNAML